jgi:hypothetical protein
VARTSDDGASGANRSASLDEDGLKPSAMRGKELLYGYVVALELIGVAIADLTITKGKGAPKHPDTTLMALGLVLSLALLGILQLRHRLIVGFAAIIADYMVVLPKVPTRLAATHIVALIIPVGYALVLAQRQRKAMLRGAPPRTPAAAARAKAEARPEGRRSRRKAKPEPTGPAPSRRYTPPKAKRAQR